VRTATRADGILLDNLEIEQMISFF
jgi:hypothetical protein